MEIDQAVAFAFILTLIAGLSTGIGSAIAFFFKRPKMSYLAFALGLSAGVMIYVSFMELMPNAIDELNAEGFDGDLWAAVAFFLGILVIAVIDLVIPHDANPHEFAEDEELDAISTQEPIPAGMCSHEEGEHPIGGTDAEALDALRHGAERKSNLMRVGIFTALAIAIHNFPEGLATFVTALSDPGLGIAIAIAIAIHNIPEGISVSVPIFYATGDRKKAFWISFLSGVAEPIGALVGFALLMPFIDGNPAILPGLLAFVAGIMVYISIDELLPLAHRYGKEHVVLIGLILGMFIMALSLIMLAWA
jgi:ZIP family zinc transporter